MTHEKTTNPEHVSENKEVEAQVYGDPLNLAMSAYTAARRNNNAVLLNVQGRSSYTDFILILSADSDRQMQAVAQRIQHTLAALGTKPLGVEGEGQGGWVLMDYGDVVIHIFRETQREFYNLEGLWIEAPREQLPEIADQPEDEDEDEDEQLF